MNDNESGLYYLQSRYYDPKICRFINADGLVSTGQGPLGYNMFAYCNNNPISRIDGEGSESYNCMDDDPNNDNNPFNDVGGGNNAYAQDAGQGFSSFHALKNFLGSAGKGMHWHHIVERCQIARSGFTSEQIHNTANVIAIDRATHAKITGHYNTTSFQFTNGLSVRNWLSGQPYEVQYNYGINVLHQYGIMP